MAVQIKQKETEVKRDRRGFPTDEQDIKDTLKCAEAYLNLERCPECKRIKVSGYVCIHCDYAG